MESERLGFSVFNFPFSTFNFTTYMTKRDALTDISHILSYKL